MSRPPIAVVGVSALFPGSTDHVGFWKDILAGRDMIDDVPETHWLTEDYYDPDPTAPDKTYAKRGGFLKEVDFDALGWGVPPSIIPATDTSQLLALIVAERVLRDAAGGQFEAMDRSRISCILGVTSAQELLATMVSRLQRPVWVKALREQGLPESQVQAACQAISDHYQPWQESSFPGLLGNVVAGRIANRLDLGGTNCVTDAACASTFSALSMAVNELYLGDSDMVIAGGVDTLNDIFMFMCFSKTPALSMSGDVRPFSDQADGTMLGEGLGMVALKRLEDAERDGDTVYAVIRGVGSSSDGRSKSVYAPVSAGQANSLTRAYGIAGFDAGTVELVEAHGTGTKAGDAAEFGGLRLAFEGADLQGCALGTVKSQIGHTKAAAGAAGLFKAVMALHHKVLPPTIKIDRPNPALELETSPFYLNTEARPWIRPSDHPRRAGVSSFGFGGSNFHIAVEEYVGPNPAARSRTLPEELILVGGVDGAEVAAQARALAARDVSAARLGWETAQSWTGGAARLAVVGGEGVGDRLTAAAEAIEKAPTAAFEHPGSFYGLGEQDGDVAFLFPGQGSQYVGMGSQLAMSFDAARSAWDRAAELQFDGQRIDHVVHPIPRFSDEARAADQDTLRRTEWAQPGIGACSLGSLGLLRSLGVSASAVAGHSFGELTALHAAGVWDEQSFLQAARKRGELMAEAAELPGGMIAVSGTIEEVSAVLEGVEGVVVANHNAPKQVVISGALQALDGVEAALASAGLRAKRLQVATAFHSPIVAGGCEPFGAFLGELNFESASVAVYSGETAEEYGDVAPTLARQIANPVRWTSTIEALHARGVRTFIEVGPGAVLTGLVGRILKGQDHAAISTDRKGKHGATAFLLALARLAARGVTFDPKALWIGFDAPIDPAEVAKPKLAIAINGSNHGKAYPPQGGAAALPAPNPEEVPVAHTSDGVSDGVRNTPFPNSTPRAPAMSSVSAGVRSSRLPIEAPQHPAGSSVQAAQTAVVVAPAPLAIPTPAAPTQPVGAGWLGAWEEAQRQNSSAHTAFQQAMAQSHTAFLQTVESGFRSLAALSGSAIPASVGQVVNTHASIPAHTAPIAAAPAYAAPVISAPVAPIVAAPIAAPVVQAPAPVVQAPTPVAAPVAQAPAPVVEVPPAPIVEVPPAAPTLDLHALMLAVVADKTGYPADMLDVSMDLEGDLGIDSIKRVEILAAVQEQAPGMPDVDAAHMGSLRTLGDIVEYMQGLMGQTATAAPTAPAAPTIDLHALMLAVVADKTGYPADMLDVSMDLEGDLGIDSIKRVEILAAVQEQAPGMPDVDAAHMGSLRTLGDIVEYMQGLMGQTAASSPATPAAPTVDLHALMLDVVADKTGYPADMLDVSMDLEGDLGIDSIKRVEILAAVQEQAPGMPDVDAAHMGSLRTLGDIVEYMQGLMGQTTTPAPAKTPAATVATEDLGRYDLVLQERPALGFAQPGLQDVTVVGPIADTLAAELTSRGITAHADSEVRATDTAVILTAGLAHAASTDEATTLIRGAFADARTLAPNARMLVTVQDTGGDFGTTNPTAPQAILGSLAALARTASQEWDDTSVKTIDIHRAGQGDAALATAIADELFRGAADAEVALNGGHRSVPTSVLAAVPTGSQSMEAGDVAVVSGGARGVTAACVVAWSKATQGRFVLLGRTQLAAEPTVCKGADTDAALKKALLQDARANGRTPSPKELQSQVRGILSGREIRGTVAAIEANGGQAQYVSVDVTDAEALSTALTTVRSDWGPIRALVHGAGVLADRFIAEQTDEQFDRVWNTKITGLEALLTATAVDDLKVLCVFSSVAARCGNRGQVAYAMANEALNKLAWAERSRRPNTLVKSMGWGPWRGGMVGPELAARFAALGVAMIPLDDGAQMFVDELRSTTDQVELVLGGEPRAEALMSASGERRLDLEVSVGAATHPWLRGHTIGGTVVVPMALVSEWFARAAQALRPELRIKSLNDVRVLRGIKLSDFDTASQRLLLSVRQLSNGRGAQLEVELRTADGAPAYRAGISMVEPTDRTRSQDATPSLRLDDWGGAPIYGDVLFHSEEFQVIQQLDGVGPTGISGQLAGVQAAGWGWDRWTVDVAALDGGLQLALLWARRELGGAVLPMGFGELRIDGHPPEGVVQCVAQCVSQGSNKARADLSFLDSNGRCFASVKGVDLVLRPDAAAPSPRA